MFFGWFGNFGKSYYSGKTNQYGESGDSRLSDQYGWSGNSGEYHDFGESGEFCSKCDVHIFCLWQKQVSEGIRIQNYINKCVNIFVSKFVQCLTMSEYV